MLSSCSHIWRASVVWGLTLGDEDGVFQVGGGRVVVEHLVGHEDDEAERK